MKKIINYKQLYINEKNIRENIEKKLEIIKREINNHKKKLEEKEIQIKNLINKVNEKNKELELLKKPKGYKCSLNGNNYEKQIHNIIKYSSINNKPFNTQIEKELAGSSSKNDIECNFIKEKNVGVEVKISNTPDWMQCSIKFNNKLKQWEATTKNRIPNKCRDIFNNLINNINLYDGDIPPFMIKQLTHEEWIKIKNETDKWSDKYIDIPSDTISKLYKAKGCNYIQINNGYGLYHLGNNICNFDVPIFDIEQQLRIRTKIHTIKNKKGLCSLSVIAACQPKNIKKLIPSKYSLDDKNKLPPPLIYKL